MIFRPIFEFVTPSLGPLTGIACTNEWINHHRRLIQSRVTRGMMLAFPIRIVSAKLGVDQQNSGGCNCRIVFIRKAVDFSYNICYFSSKQNRHFLPLPSLLQVSQPIPVHHRTSKSVQQWFSSRGRSKASSTPNGFSLIEDHSCSGCGDGRHPPLPRSMDNTSARPTRSMWSTSAKHEFNIRQFITKQFTTAYTTIVFGYIDYFGLGGIEGYFSLEKSTFILFFIGRSIGWSVDQWVGFFVSIETRNPNSSVLSEQFNSNLVDPSYLRHVVARLLTTFGQHGRFPWATRLTTALSWVRTIVHMWICFSHETCHPPSPDRPRLCWATRPTRDRSRLVRDLSGTNGILSTMVP